MNFLYKMVRSGAGALGSLASALLSMRHSGAIDDSTTPEQARQMLIDRGYDPKAVEDFVGGPEEKPNGHP